MNRRGFFRFALGAPVALPAAAMAHPAPAGKPVNVATLGIEIDTSAALEGLKALKAEMDSMDKRMCVMIPRLMAQAKRDRRA